MPVFDFRCSECGEKVEKIVSSAVREIECPKCGGKAEKQLSAPAEFLDKGTVGFYKAGGNYSRK